VGASCGAIPLIVLFLTLRKWGNVVQAETNHPVEREALQADLGRFRRCVGKGHALVEGHGGDRTELMVDMGAERADPIGRPDDPHTLRIDVIDRTHLVFRPLDNVWGNQVIHRRED